MRRITAAVFACLPIFLCAKAHTQDVFSTTNSATRSYNYVEVQYLPAMEVDLPLEATLVVDINDAWSFHGRFDKRDAEGALLVNGTPVYVDASEQNVSAGFLYHRPFTKMANSDWVAGLLIGRSSLEATATGQNNIGQTVTVELSSSTGFQEAYLGIRRTLNPQLEGEVGINILRVEDDITPSGTVKLVYRIIPSVDVAVGMREIGDDNLFGIGFRYTW